MEFGFEFMGGEMHLFMKKNGTSLAAIGYYPREVTVRNGSARTRWKNSSPPAQ